MVQFESGFELQIEKKKSRVNLEAIIQTSSYIGWSVVNCSFV